MRKKTFYLPEEIISGLYTSGREWQTEDGKEYRGAYHRYITKEVYTGSTWDSKTSKKLLPFIDRAKTAVLYKELKKSIRTKYLTPTPFKPVVTDKIRKDGVFNRYFLQKINEQKIIEVDETHFRALDSGVIDKNLYNSIQIRWYVSGNIEDTISGSNVEPGVRSKNQKQVTAANKYLPGITGILTDPLQLYTDNDFKVPKDING
jgi:hypothetical protein